MPKSTGTHSKQRQRALAAVKDFLEHLQALTVSYSCSWGVMKQVKVHESPRWRSRTDGKYRIRAGIAGISKPVAVLDTKAAFCGELENMIRAIGRDSIVYLVSAFEALLIDSGLWKLARCRRNAGVPGAVCEVARFLGIASPVTQQCRDVVHLRNDIIHRRAVARKCYSFVGKGMKNRAWNQDLKTVTFAKGKDIAIQRIDQNVIVSVVEQFCQEVVDGLT